MPRHRRPRQAQTLSQGLLADERVFRQQAQQLLFFTVHGGDCKFLFVYETIVYYLS
jgi:hypothetical protein